MPNKKYKMPDRIAVDARRGNSGEGIWFVMPSARHDYAQTHIPESSARFWGGVKSLALLDC